MKRFLLITMVVILIFCVAITTTSFATDTNVEDSLTDGTNAIEEDTTENDDTDQSNENTETNEIEWTDVSNVTIKLERYEQLGTIVAIVDNLEYKEDHHYYIHFSNEKETIDLPHISSDNAYENGWDYIYEGMPGNINVDNEVIEKNAPIYAYLCETVFSDGNWVTKILIEAKELERPTQLSLGNRLKAYFFNDETSTSCYEVLSNERKENVKINYKIGTITDTDILRSIQRGDSDCLEKLMEYAKSATNGKTGSVKLGEDNSITDKLNLVDDKYYYVYMEVDDNNGEYYPIEDVSLYQALLSEDVGNNLFDYLSDEFKWNLDDEAGDIVIDDEDKNDNKDDGKDDTIAPGKIPQTGATITLVTVFAVVAIIGTIIFIKIRKMRDIK